MIVSHRVASIVRFFLIPILFYLFMFLALTWPLVEMFSTRFYCDAGDGLQNVWNLWWVNEAVTVLHQSPWHTDIIHFPYGTSLLGHTMNPFNGFLAIPLLRFMTLLEAHNFIIVFSFVVGGFNAFLLCQHISRSYVGSLLGGFIFTFSSYHFAHASGHLQLVSLEWIPLFLLFWLMLLEKPGFRIALAAAAALFTVILCDYYYFFYCVVTGFILLCFEAKKARDPFFFLRMERRLSTIAFIAACMCTSGVLAVRLLILNARDPLWGYHQAWEFSMDLLAPFIPGGHWRFGRLTEFFWSRIRGNINENNVYLGWSVIGVALYSWLADRKTEEAGRVLPWRMILLIFAAFALGPRLLIFGWELPLMRLPYAFATKLLPILDLSGMPLRMMVMAALSAGVLFANGWDTLRNGSPRLRLLSLLIVPLLIFEYLPRMPQTTLPSQPAYVDYLRDLPHEAASGDDAVLDVSGSPSRALYGQTAHRRPMALGYVARYPASVREQDLEIYRLIREKEFDSLHTRYRIRYLALPLDETGRKEHSKLRLLLEDREGGALLYDLKPLDENEQETQEGGGERLNAPSGRGASYLEGKKPGGPRMRATRLELMSGFAFNPPAGLIYWGLLILSLAGFAIRFWGLGSKGLWFDEIHTLNDSLYPQPSHNQHYLFFKIDDFFQRFSSDPTAAVRIYPALAGALSVPILYFFVARLYSASAGFLAVALFCFQPFHIYYSQEGRFYAPMIFFTLVALWATVEFAAGNIIVRVLALLVIPAAHYLAYYNHPASQPFILAHLAGLAGAFAFTDWGFDVLRRAAPPLRRSRHARLLAVVLMATAGALPLVLAPAIRQRVSETLFHSEWGGTPGVNFSWEFFAEHLSTYGWDVRLYPVFGRLSPLLTLGMMTAGVILLLRRRTYFGVWFIGILLAAFVAVFAYKTESPYLVKYVAFVQPIILTLAGIGCAGLTECGARIATRRPRRAGPSEIGMQDLSDPMRATAAPTTPAHPEPKTPPIYLRPSVRVALGVAAILIAGHFPALVRYERLTKMPLRKQFSWLNDHEPEAASVFVYGHAGYPASLYREVLPARHHLEYFSWAQDQGKLEIEVLRGAAARQVTYFAYCWPWDMPQELMTWLEEHAEETVRFPSLDGPRNDGILYRILPTEAGVAPHRTADRPATAIDGIGTLGRPEIKASGDEPEAMLSFSQTASVLYRIPVEADQTYHIQLDVMAETEGFHCLALTAEGNPPALIGGSLGKGSSAQWNGCLKPAIGADSIALAYVSDESAKPESGGTLGVRRLAIAAGESPAPTGWNDILLPPLTLITTRDSSEAGTHQQWRARPQNAFIPLLEREDDYMRLRLDPVILSSLGKTGEVGQVISPEFRVEPGGRLFLRTPIRLMEAFGFGATLQVIFMDRENAMVERRFVTSSPMACNADWDPWIAPLRGHPWNEFQALMSVPQGAASASAALLIWPSSHARIFTGTANEIHWGKLEYALVKD